MRQAVTDRRSHRRVGPDFPARPASPSRSARAAVGRRGGFILDRDRAVVRRDLHRTSATLDVPVSAYRGVAVRMFAEGEDGELARRRRARCIAIRR